MTKAPEFSWKLRASAAADLLRAERGRNSELEKRLEILEAKQTVWLNKNIDLQFRLAKAQGAYTA